MLSVSSCRAIRERVPPMAARTPNSCQRTDVCAVPAGGVSWLAHGSVVEISVARDPKQSRFRVAVWSEAERVDALSGDWVELPGAALR